MTVTIERNQDRIDIFSEFRDKELVKRIPGVRWDTDRRIWHAPLAWSACVQLRSTFGDRLKVGKDLYDWSMDYHRTRIQPAMGVRDAEDVPGREDMYPYQRVGVQFMRKARRIILGDEMGTGKTFQTIQTLVEEDAFPALIVCPNSLKRVWIREFEKWAPEVNARIIRSKASFPSAELERLPGIGGSTAEKMREAGIESPRDILERVTDEELLAIDGVGPSSVKKIRKKLGMWYDDSPDVWITNWESLRGLSRVAGYGSIKLSERERTPGPLNRVAWKAVIADEAHRAKDPGSKQTRAWWAICHGLSNPELPNGVDIRACLTGTPIADTLVDAWSLLHGLDPDEWPSKRKYIDRYALASMNVWGGLEIFGIRPEMRDEFFGLFDLYFLRRPKAAVLKHLPEKPEPQKRYVPMHPKQKKAYEQMVEHMIAMVGEDGEATFATNPLTKLTRLQQFACAYAELDEENRVRLTTPSNKVDELLKILDETDEKVVAFAESRQLIELCEEACADKDIHYVSIHGGVSEEDRDANIQEFQNGRAKVMLVTLGAGGEGITLTAAPIAVFLQRSYSLIKNKQAEDRIHRPGAEQHERIFYIDVMSEGTVEDSRFERLMEKGVRFEEIVRDEKALRNMLLGKDKDD